MITRILLAVALTVGAAACSSSDDPPASAVEDPTTTTVAAEAPAWPDPDWDTVAATDAGLDPATLAAMAAGAEAAGSACLVITRDGELVAEHYWKGTDAATKHEAFSVTKSITATLVGLAADRDLLDIDQPASDFITEWKGTPSEGVTIRNLLSMDSGRYYDWETDYSKMAGQAQDKTAFAIGLTQQHDPGTHWEYNNSGVQVLEHVLEVVTGQPVDEFARESLFEPIGMASTINKDAAGNTLTFMGAQTSCRDLARFGLLYLRGGEWDGEQVLSRAFVEAATSRSTELTDDYGYLWWLYEATATPRHYVAHGLFDQIVAVFPDSEVVVTRMGSQSGDDGSTFGVDAIASGVEDALEAG